MPAITYKEFGGGLDRRLPINVQDANRLWVLKNAYITAGMKIAKRPGLRLVSDMLSGSVGLETLGGGLCVFAPIGSTFVPPTGVGVLNLSNYSPLELTTTLVDVLAAQMFQSHPYVVAVHYTRVPNPPSPPGQASVGGSSFRNVIRHHYIDGTTPTYISDTNCPHGASITKAADRIFTIGDDVVSYCAVGAARDWTTASDAGFLPASRQQDTTADPTAVGTFEDALVVAFADGSQVWDVAVDPSANQFRRKMDGVGTTHPQSMAGFYRDLVFASPFGVRSMSVQENVERIDETDVGVPIDKLVVPAQTLHEQITTRPVLGVWVQQLGQYWLVYASSDSTSRVFAYSFSRSSKLACWSEYTFPILITGMATKAGKVYVRSATSLYELTDTQYTDAGTLIDVDVQMAYQDAKLPGVEKMFYGADYVFSGSPTITYLYDPQDQTKETVPMVISGDTRAATMVPVEVCAAAIAPRFRHSADEAFGLDLATLYYHSLSASV
jgi:hypothetical protein